jgi:hypothetical protein
MFRLAGPGANFILRSTNTIKFLPASSPRRKSVIPLPWQICSPKSSPLLRPSSVTALTMASRFHALFWTTSPTLKWSFHRTKPAVFSGAGDIQRDHHIEVIAQHGRLAWQRITGYNLRNYAELAMQRYKRIFGNTMKARAATAENRGMDQCVCTEPNDQSRYAGVRESLKSSEHRGALLNFFFNNALQTGAAHEGNLTPHLSSASLHPTMRCRSRAVQSCNPVGGW